MKFERLDSDKIRIILNIQDLKSHNIDFNSFMANSDKTQDLFLYILDVAKEKAGFTTNDYKISIETLYLNNGYFVLNITRFKDNFNSKLPRVVAKKKSSYNQSSDSYIYSFKSLDDFLDFYSEIKKIIGSSIWFNFNYSLYFYNNIYYFLTDFKQLDDCNKNIFLYILSEYACLKCNNKIF